MMTKECLIADSSFYICFLDCINEPASLIKILDVFQANVTPKVFSEINKSKNSYHILNKKDLLTVFKGADINLGEALRPFVSEKELEKGEHEVIVLAYVFYNINIGFFFIIDELSKRKLVEKNLPYLTKNLYGTLGFIGICHSKYNIFNKTESLNLLNKIGCSSFRADKKIIEEVIKKIQNG
jgi:predicted nucleic acid-binding protein